MDLLKMLGVSCLTSFCSTNSHFSQRHPPFPTSRGNSGSDLKQAPPARSPEAPPPFLLTLAKPLCMLIGGGLIQFAAVVDQWWITFPSFGLSFSLSLWGREDLGGGNNSGGVEPTDNVPLCSTSSSLPILRENNKNVFSDNVYCVTDGSSQWNRAEITRSDIVFRVLAGGKERIGREKIGKDDIWHRWLRPR